MAVLTIVALGAVLFLMWPGAFNVVMVMIAAIVLFMVVTWIEESAAERKPPTDKE